jgi:Protein of unknown function (DUF3015)
MRILQTIAITAALLLASHASAQGIKGTGKYGTAGCGLGSLAFGDQPGGVQILASTTNGTFGTQTFGITSGTSNCGKGVFAQGTKNFVEANREVLAKDAARGEGEAIGAIAVINDCRDVRAVGAALQRDFQAIFPSEQATSDEVTQAILRTLHSDPALGCGQG